MRFKLPCLLLFSLRIITGLIIALIVIVVVLRAEIDVVEYDAEYLCAYVLQKLSRTTNNLTRALSGVNNEDHSINHRRDQYTIRKGRDRRRVDDKMSEMSLEKL